MQRNPAHRQDLSPEFAASRRSGPGRALISSSERVPGAPVDRESMLQARELLMAEGVVRHFLGRRGLGLGPFLVSVGVPVNHCHNTMEAH